MAAKKPSGDRGFIDGKPRRESLERVDMARAILAEYRDFLPLTLRQIFYRAVGQYGFDKDEKAYDRLGYTLAKARRAQMIDMGDIRDDGVTKELAPGFAGLHDFEDLVRGMGKSYRRQRQMGQDFHILLLCEAGGMVPQLARVAGEYGVDVQSSGGYDSVTAKYELARTPFIVAARASSLSSWAASSSWLPYGFHRPRLEFPRA